MRMRTLETCFGATVTSFSVVFLFIPFKFFFLIFLCPVVLIIHHYYHGMLHHITKITSKHTNHKSPVQSNLRWDCDTKTASNICNYNRHYAEHSGYFEGKPQFIAEAKSSSTLEFYDSNTGRLLFTAPIGRTMDDFLIESKAHGTFVPCMLYGSRMFTISMVY